MPDERRQDEDGGFKKIFALIAATHLAVLGLILFLSFQPLKPQNDTLVWMAPGSFADAAAEAGQNAVSQAALTPSEPPEPTPDAADEPTENQTPPPPPPTLPTPAPPAEVMTPPPTPAPAEDHPDLALTTPTPSPAATPAPRPTPKPAPTVTPKQKLTPKPVLKSTPTPAPRPRPFSKPKPSPKPRPSPTPKSKPASEGADDKKHQKPQASPSPRAEAERFAKNNASHTRPDASGNSGTGVSKDAGQGSATSDATLAFYAEVIKSRFQAAWNQPHGEIAPGTELVATVKLKIEPDGSVTEFTLVDGSGNSVVDDSVREAGRKITKLPPPPDGTAFSPVVRFELGN